MLLHNTVICYSELAGAGFIFTAAKPFLARFSGKVAKKPSGFAAAAPQLLPFLQDFS